MIIRSKEDLKQAYELLYFCGVNYKFAYQIKKAIREYYRLENERLNDQPLKRVYDRDGGYRELITVPAEVVDIENWYKGYVYIAPYYTYYDCTGRPFSAWHKITNYHGKPAIIHRVCLDV